MGYAHVSSKRPDDLNGNPRPERAPVVADAESRPGLDYDALADTAPMSPPPWSCAKCGDETGPLYCSAGDDPLLCEGCAKPEDVLARDVVLP